MLSVVLLGVWSGEGRKHAHGAAQRLAHFLELRAQWLALSGEQAATIARLAQAALHFELSRRACWALPCPHLWQADQRTLSACFGCPFHQCARMHWP